MKHFVWLTLALVGCAAPHRTGMTMREVRSYQGRPDGLVTVEVWKDVEKGGGWFLLTDPDISSLTAVHTNQTALGGGSSVNLGPSTVKVDPQTGAIIGATGTAVGNVIGAAVKSAIK